LIISADASGASLAIAFVADTLKTGAKISASNAFFI
jgi:hypothetical protein